MSQFSRRGFLKAMGIGAGAAVGTRLAGSSLLGVAKAATPEPTALVCIFLSGGINAIFTGADSFLNVSPCDFGVTSNNMADMGNGLFIDRTLADVIPDGLKNNVASIGIRHRISAHGQAQRANFVAESGASAPLMLASAIGGSGTIKAAVLGSNTLPNGVTPNPVDGISLQPITDMASTIEALGGSTNTAANAVDRNGAARGVEAASAMSKAAVEKSPRSLVSVGDGFGSAIETLKKPVIPFNPAEFSAAYGLNGTAIMQSTADERAMRSQLAAAELMIRSGTNVCVISNGGGGTWDSHGDTDGARVRRVFNARIATALQIFLNRVVLGTIAERNVMVALFGDFHRSRNGSDHQSNLAALVIGKNFKNGTTGKTAPNVSLPDGTPGIEGFWSCLAGAAKVDKNPFNNGKIEHAALLA